MLNNILFCELRIRRLKLLKAYSAFPVNVCLMHYLYPQKSFLTQIWKRSTLTDLYPRRGYSTLVWVGMCPGMCGRPEGPKMGACRTDQRYIWGTVQLILFCFVLFCFFFDKILLSEVICGPNWGFLNWIHRYLGLGTENLPKLSILNGKFGNVVWFWAILD